jgi:predicted ArsR family transcriptional regulator
VDHAPPAPDRWSAVAALTDRSRRALYAYVCDAGRPVNREEAAEATGVSRGLAAFHLDKMVEVGLLAASYQAPAGQPRGRGRTPKVYVPAGDGVAVTLPERRYELIAEILAAAVAAEPDPTGTGGGPYRAAEAARAQAFAHGHAVGAGPPPGTDLLATLRDLGFEPERRGGEVVLRNCPFHALAQRHTALVCGLNEAFLTGLVAGAGADLDARLAPGSGACCVRLSCHTF